MQSRGYEMAEVVLNEQVDFSALTGRGVKVAILDSGVDANHPKVGALSGGVGLDLDSQGHVIFNDDYDDCAGHGTACAGLIRSAAPDAELYSVRLFDGSLSVDGKVLIAAMEWAIGMDMDVINMSLGTTEMCHRDELWALCRKATDADIALVAAGHNEGVESYPSSFPEVIGVGAGEVYGRYEYVYAPGADLECLARANKQRLCWLEGREIMSGGTSFAAPRISGLVALVKEAFAGANLCIVRRLLRENAVQLVGERDSTPDVLVGTNSSETPVARLALEWISKAVVYPYNKEMHGLIRFADQLSFDVVGVVDPPGKGLVGLDAGEAIGLPHANCRISSDLPAALANADTLILSYVDQLGRIGKRDVLRESIEIALDCGVNIYSLSKVPADRYGDLYSKAAQRHLNICYPSIPPNEVKRLIDAPSHPALVDVPVVGIFGTSSQQGKFTAQLALGRQLQKMGYRIGQVGTEHQADLFGMDCTFPMGYDSPIDLPIQFFAPFLQAKISEICRKKHPDLILAGSQSGTIPYSLDEHGFHLLPSVAFMLGTKPDACVLVVNSIDPEEYILDTIHALKILARAPTIVIAMGDKEKHIRTAYGREWVTPRQMSAQEIESNIKRLEDKFCLPVVEISSGEGQKQMANEVVNFFSS